VGTCRCDPYERSGPHLHAHQHEAGISRHEARNCMRRRTSMQGWVSRCSSYMRDVHAQSCMQVAVAGGAGFFWGKGEVCGMGARGGADAGIWTRPRAGHPGVGRSNRKLKAEQV
jgi:hypothetical protein